MVAQWVEGSYISGPEPFSQPGAVELTLRGLKGPRRTLLDLT